MGVLVNENGEDAIIIINSESLSGDIAKELKKRAIELIDSGIKSISLDLSKTDYIDSSGVGKILFINKTMMKNENKFKIEKTSPILYSFLESLAITKIIKIEKT